MIARFLKTVADDMYSRKYPVDFKAGPEPIVRNGYSNVIRVERDRGAGDTLLDIGASDPKRRRYAVRRIALLVDVYAQSGVEGARVLDHEELADFIVDAFMVSVNAWVQQFKTHSAIYGAGRFLTAGELNDEQTWPGVVYRVPLQLHRGVYRQDYDGEGLPTVELFRVNSDAVIKQPGADDLTLPTAISAEQGN